MSVFLKNDLSLATLGIALTFLTLLTLAMIDFYYKMVPDSLNLLALTLAIISVNDPQMLGLNFINALPFLPLLLSLRTDQSLCQTG
jgi:leader peptidase (prepilin peptidase)/N-methyltransferase